METAAGEKWVVLDKEKIAQEVEVAFRIAQASLGQNDAFGT